MYEITELMLNRASIPQLYWDSQIASVDDIKLREKLARTMSDTQRLVDGEGLLIVGPMGSGKTAFGNILLRLMIGQGILVYYVKAFDLLSNWREKQVCLKNKVILIDDLGLEPIGVNYQLLLEYALRQRHEGRRGTILTTNLSLTEIKRNYPATFVSVLQRVCSKVLVINNRQWEEAPDEY